MEPLSMKVIVGAKSHHSCRDHITFSVKHHYQTETVIKRLTAWKKAADIKASGSAIVILRDGNQYKLLKVGDNKELDVSHLTKESNIIIVDKSDGVTRLSLAGEEEIDLVQQDEDFGQAGLKKYYLKYPPTMEVRYYLQISREECKTILDIKEKLLETVLTPVISSGHHSNPNLHESMSEIEKRILSIPVDSSMVALFYDDFLLLDGQSTNFLEEGDDIYCLSFPFHEGVYKHFSKFYNAEYARPHPSHHPEWISRGRMQPMSAAVPQATNFSSSLLDVNGLHAESNLFRSDAMKKAESCVVDSFVDDAMDDSVEIDSELEEAKVKQLPSVDAEVSDLEKDRDILSALQAIGIDIAKSTTIIASKNANNKPVLKNSKVGQKAAAPIQIENSSQSANAAN